MTSEELGLDELLRIDVDAQLLKLATCQLEDDLDLVIEILRAAVFAGTREIQITQRRGTLSITTSASLLSRETSHALQVAADPRSDAHERQRGIELVEHNAGAGWLALLGRKDLTSHARCSPDGAPPDLSLNLPTHADAREMPRRSSLRRSGSFLIIRGLNIQRRSLQQRIGRRVSRFGPRLDVFGLDPRSLQQDKSHDPVHATLQINGLEPTLEAAFSLSRSATVRPARVFLSHGGFVRGGITLENLQGFELVLNLDPFGPTLPALETLRRGIQNSTFGIEERLAHAVTRWAIGCSNGRLSRLREVVIAALAHRRESPLRSAKVFEYFDSTGLHRASWDQLISSTREDPFTYIGPESRAWLRRQTRPASSGRVWIAAPETAALLRDEYAIQVRAFRGARRRSIARDIIGGVVEGLARVAAFARGRPLPRAKLTAREVSVLEHLNASLDPQRSNGRQIELSGHRGSLRCTREHWLLPRVAPGTRELVAAVHAHQDTAHLAILALGHPDAVPSVQATSRFHQLVSRLTHERSPDPSRGPSSGRLPPAERSKEEALS